MTTAVFRNNAQRATNAQNSNLNRPVLGMARITLLSPTKGLPRAARHRTVGLCRRITVVRRNNVQRTSIPSVEEKRRLASVSQARTRYGPGASEPLNTAS